MADREAVIREQLAAFRPLLALSKVMTGNYDEAGILGIATAATPSLGGCRTEGIYIDDDWRVIGPVGRPANADSLRAQLTALDPLGGALTVQDAGWAWAYPLAGVEVKAGHLVVSCDTEPKPHHQFLLNVLAKQAGAALLNARMHARERAIADALRTTNLALARAIADLARSSAAVQRSLDIHNSLTAVASAGQGQAGIARALHELTGLPVAIEDRHGNLTAWAGPGQPVPYPKCSSTRRERTVRRAAEARGPVRDKGRLIALAQPGSVVLGVIALIDPNRTAGDSEKVALEHANTVLALELAHLQALRETELRFRRDLSEELLAGTDPESAQDRARALGYDLARPHRVVIVTNGNRHVDNEAFFHAVRRAMRDTGAGSLLTARPGGVAVLCDTDQDWEQFRAKIITRIGSGGIAGSVWVDPAPSHSSSHALTSRRSSP